MSVFERVIPLILGNKNLLQPQIEAYASACSHYAQFPQEEFKETLIVMPTGSGKTGLMSILPFGLSTKRVLIITPGKIVRKTVFKEFDSVNNPESTFWYKHKIILSRREFPVCYMYKGFNKEDELAKTQTMKKLKSADIVITNIHKIVGSNDHNNLINLMEKDDFDLIIVDEAHHVAAGMWKEALSHFEVEKIIKLTATPFRSDKQEITKNKYDPIYEYTLSEAIDSGLVKDIVRKVEIPYKLELINTETGKSYSLEEAKEELGDDWVSRTVAMSKECSKQVINYTKKTLLDKRKSYSGHQILAITCNIPHAESVTEWFKQAGLSATYVHGDLSDVEIDRRLNDYRNGIYDVMVSIQMLGEGYDNPNISIISIFRPFKTLSPYAQAIGRGLRRIRGENIKEIDNFCNVVYHKELNLEELWRYYKEQKEFGSLIKKQTSMISEQLTLFSLDELGYVEKRPSQQNVSNSEPIYGDVVFSGSVSSYKSRGIGNIDSFSEKGVLSYFKARHEFVASLQAQLDDEITKIKELQSNGLISEDQANLLISEAESRTQNKSNQEFNEARELYLAEQLNIDFTKWINNNLEEFFKKSKLKKDGFELASTLETDLASKKVDNIGYIVRNFRIEMYNLTKKNVNTYNERDFAKAKELFLNKLEFYLEQYGTRNEGEK